MLKKPPSIRRLLSVLAFGAIVFTAISSIATSVSDRNKPAFADGTDTPVSCDVLSLNGACADNFSDVLTAIKSSTPNHIKLYADIDDTGSGLYQFKAHTETTIDFNGHTINTNRSFLIYGATVNLTGTGKLSINHTFPINFLGSTSPAASDFSVLNVDSGVELESAYEGIWDMMSMSYTANSYLPRKYGITINFNGKVTQKYPTSSGRVFYINGTYGETGVNFYWGPTAYANATTGMYVAGGANVVYAGTMELQTAGIEVRGGSLNVIGGSISVNANQPYEVRSNPKNGMATLGTAITITQHVTKLPIDVSISNGTFTAAKPLVEFDAVGNGDAAYTDVTGVISGGNFYSTSTEDTVSTAHWKEYITGGDYTPARLDQSYIHPLYEDEEINTAYWRVYPREVDMNHKTIASDDSAALISTVDLQNYVLADRRFPVEFHTLAEDTISEVQAKNSQIPNIIAGTSIEVLRDNGDSVIVSDDNEVTLSLGVTKAQYDTLSEFDLVNAHLLNRDDLSVSERFPASLSQTPSEAQTSGEATQTSSEAAQHYLVSFRLMGLGTSSYVVSGENLPKEDDNTSENASQKDQNSDQTSEKENSKNNSNDSSEKSSASDDSSKDTSGKTSPLKDALEKISPNVPNTSMLDGAIFFDDTFIEPLGATLAVPDTGFATSQDGQQVATIFPVVIASIAITTIAYLYYCKQSNAKQRVLVSFIFSALVAGFGLSSATVFADESTTTSATTPTTSTTECAVLSLNDVCMDSFADMLASIKTTTPNYVKLYSDITDTSTSLYQFKSYTDTTIDFNGHTISTSRSFLIYGATVNLTGTGTLSINNTFPINFLGSSNASASDFSVFNVDSGVTLEGAYNGVWDMMSMAYTAATYLPRKYGITVNFNGKITSKYPNVSSSVLYINGQYGMTGMNFYWGPTAYANTNSGMYIAGGANVTYAGTMELQAAGIEIRGGSLNVIGGSISVSADQPYTLRSNPTSGMAALGTAITVTQHTTRLPIDVSISGGSFTADKPLVELDAVNNGDESYETVTGSISGGNFYSTSDQDAVEVAHWTEFITGGDYTPARLDQTYINPLYEDEEINTEYWRVYPREVDINNKTVANNGSEDLVSSISLDSEILADRKYPVEFDTLDETTLANAQVNNPQISNIIAGTSINILRDNGDKVLIDDNNEVTLSLGVTAEQYATLSNFDNIYAHLLDAEGNVTNSYTASLDTLSDDTTGKTYYLVKFKVMGLGASTYVISGINDLNTNPDDSSTDNSTNTKDTTSDTKNSPNIPNTGLDTDFTSVNAPKVPDTGTPSARSSYLTTTAFPAIILAITSSIVFCVYYLKKHLSRKES